MGLSSSKRSAAGPSSNSSPAPLPCGVFVRRSGSAMDRILNSSCPRSRRSDNEDAKLSERSYKESKKKSSTCQVPSEAYRRAKAGESNEPNCSNSIIRGEANTSSSRDIASCSSNPHTGFLPRLSFYPGNLSFRKSRARNEEDEFPMDRNGGSRICDYLPPCFTSRSLRRRQEEICSSGSSPGFSDHSQDDHPSLRNRSNSRMECSLNSLPQFNHIHSDGAGSTHNERRVPLPAREPVERNVRFSRTLSVGRLRDRVLRRATSDLELSHLQPDREVRLHRRREVEAASDAQVSSSGSHPFYGGENNTQEATRGRAREARYADLLENRSHFLERRRRIRSHVRALQRLGSRFESLSSHERSCILSGQHRGGHCDCRFARQEVTRNDDGNATASISRIVMLAEALFEVLDEIHQQSVELSSRPSASPIGSIPAPSEAVESLPLKVFSKLKKKSGEDAAQCYICLVECEEGDSMRILPCHHEFHTRCIDKWLKEIRRVCPLCRRDICRRDPSTV